MSCVIRYKKSIHQRNSCYFIFLLRLHFTIHRRVCILMIDAYHLQMRYALLNYCIKAMKNQVKVIG